MQYDEARHDFINNWGEFGINWGVNRILAQIHGLLLISYQPMCADHIMEELNISRGSVNTNLRILCDWELVFKEHITETRKEFFVAEKDMWKVFCQIITHRKKKELDPLLNSLETLASMQPTCDKSREFAKMIGSIEAFSKKADKALTSIVKGKPNIIVSTYLKIM
jgi:DNA-binding transcriptional regulator GbsR (MarR family)